MPSIQKEHPPSHRRRSKTYFMPCTIKLHPIYQHITQTFSPLLKANHPSHNNASRIFPNLSSYINQKRQYPTPNILFALITTLSPNINTCKHLIRNSNPDWPSVLLIKLYTLRNPPERRINTIHPYTQLIQNNQTIINPPTTIHTNIYKFIHQPLTRQTSKH